MKILFTLLFLSGLFIGGAVNAQAQQTPLNTKCNDDSALSWNMNIESDVDRYHVYASNNPIDVAVDNTALILMTIPQPALPAVEVIHPLNSSLAQGDKYFRVTALDAPANNESPMSLEVGCLYNLIPSAPDSVKIIIKLNTQK